jgi:hypothetical protein
MLGCSTTSKFAECYKLCGTDKRTVLLTKRPKQKDERRKVKKAMKEKKGK